MKNLAVKYGFFAGITILVNLLVQYIFFSWSHFLSLAMVAGTGSGLVLKYLLDKKYIFYDQDSCPKSNLKKFSAYSLTGVGTTMVFWGFEFIFHYLLDGDWAKYLGAVIGLMIGYLLKYQLDKRLVFQQTESICNL